MKGNQLFQDILSYSLPLIGCPESSSNEDIHVATGRSKSLLFILYYWAYSLGVKSFHFSIVEKYMKKLFGTSKDQMGVDQKAVLLVSKVNESKRHGERWTSCPGHLWWRLQAAKLLFCCSSSLHHLQGPEEMEAPIAGAG